MSRSDNAEVASIQCRDRIDPKTLGTRDYRSVDRSKRQILILSHELRDPQPVSRRHRISREVACGQIPQESHLGLSADPILEQVGHLCDYELRHDQRAWMGQQKRQALGVIPITFVDIRI